MDQAKQELTAAAVADCVDGSLEGDGSVVIRTVATLDEAGPDALTWVGSAAYLSKLAASRAGVVLVPREGEVPLGRTVIRVDDPDLALGAVLTRLAPPRDEVPTGVHPTAQIGEGAVVEGAAIGPNVFVGVAASVGPGTTLHHGVYVGRDTRIGRDCTLWPNVVVREGVTLGDRVVIHPNATIGADGFSYLWRGGKHIKIPQIGSVVIEDDVEIGANSTIDRARSGVTRIGRGTKIDNLVIIAHNCDIDDGCIIVAQVGIAGSVKLGKHVVIGGQGGVIDHITVGDGAQCAAASVIFKNQPAGSILRGAPAVDKSRFHREQASLRKLPELRKTVKVLEERIRRLESSTG